MAGPVPPPTPPSVNSPPQLPSSRGNRRLDSDEGPVGATGVCVTFSPQDTVAITEAKRPATNAAREFIGQDSFCAHRASCVAHEGCKLHAPAPLHAMAHEEPTPSGPSQT